MHPIPDHSPLLLLATAIAAKRRPATPEAIIAAIDFLQETPPGAERLADTVRHLAQTGLLQAGEEGISLTPAAQALVEALPGGKASLDQRLFALRNALADYVPAEVAANGPDKAAWQAAILEQRAAAQSTAKNLLMPKPAPEATKARPGQRQRKPLPKGKPKAKSRPR